MQTTYNKQAKVSHSNKEQLTPETNNMAQESLTKEQAWSFYCKLQLIKRLYANKVRRERLGGLQPSQ